METRCVDSGMSPTRRYDAFAITAPGLEDITAAELSALGLTPGERAPGGVSFDASPRALYSANLHLRTASRVVVRMGSFGATAFHELERRAARLPWAAFVSPGARVALSVTCRKSRLYHSDAVGERVVSAMASRVQNLDVGGDEGDDARDPAQLVLVRMLHDECTVSVDSSGALLHLRGYRQAVAKAPIRETLAAAVLIASGWTGDRPLLDPMCGAGTIPIEGALIARRIAPGLRRRFAFERWPGFEAATWREVLEEAESRVLPSSPVVIQGSDRDAGAIEAAVANAARAGVSADVELVRRSLSAIEPPESAGLVATNPPYGVRVGERDRLRNLYAQFGKVMLSRCPGWQVTFVSADVPLERQTRLRLRSLVRTSNGGIPVRIVTGSVPASAERPHPARPTVSSEHAASRTTGPVDPG